MPVRPFQLADVPAVNVLHRDVWWPERTEDGWRWLEDNPARSELGSASGWVTEDQDGRPTAFLGNFIQRFWVGDEAFFAATGFSVIVPPSVRGQSRDLIQALISQPGIFASYTLNANALSSGIYKRFGMMPWPPETHDLKLSWRIKTLPLVTARALRRLVKKEPRAVAWLGEQLMPLPWQKRAPRVSDLNEGIIFINDLSDTSPYASFWQELRGTGRLLADRSPAMMRWRLADPDLPSRPIHIARVQGDRIIGHALAIMAKYNSIEPPTLEIVDLEVLGQERDAVLGLTQQLLELAPSLGAAKVRLQVLHTRLLQDLGPIAEKARREGGWGHCHVRLDPQFQHSKGWSPTPFDGDYSFCLRPLPVKKNTS